MKYLGYLFYDYNDVSRNIKFIELLIKYSKQNNIKLILKYDKNNFKDKSLLNELEEPDLIINRSRFNFISDYFYKKNDKILFINKPFITEIANDKYKLYEYILSIDKKNKTKVKENYNLKEKINIIKTYKFSEVKSELLPLIAKNRYSYGGEDVFILDDYNDINRFNDDYIFQEILDFGKDLRVYILNNKIVKGILRTNKNDFRANYSLGGDIKIYDFNKDELDYINNILRHFEIFYGSLDFIFRDKTLFLNEIEDPVGARMLYNLTDIDIAKELINDIIKALSKQKNIKTNKESRFKC